MVTKDIASCNTGLYPDYYQSFAIFLLVPKSMNLEKNFIKNYLQ